MRSCANGVRDPAMTRPGGLEVAEIAASMIDLVYAAARPRGKLRA